MPKIQKYWDSSIESICFDILKELINLDNYNIFPHSLLKEIFMTTGFEEWENYHVDFLIRDKKGNPILGIEINGKEHYNDSTVNNHDKIKKTLFNEQAIPLISIPLIEFKTEDIKSCANNLYSIITIHLAPLIYNTNFPAYCWKCGERYSYKCRNDYEGTFYCCTNRNCENNKNNKTFDKKMIPPILSKKFKFSIKENICL